MEAGKNAFESPPLPPPGAEREIALKEALRVPRPDRPWYVAEAFRQGLTVDDVHGLSKIDPWFLRQVKELVDEAKVLAGFGRIEKMPDGVLVELPDNPSPEELSQIAPPEAPPRPVVRHLRTSAMP